MPDPHPAIKPQRAAGSDPAWDEQAAHDELADLFLRDPITETRDAPEVGSGGEAGRAAPSGTPADGLRVEVVRTPRLGSREPALLRRYAAGVAGRDGRPALLLMLGRHTISAEAVWAGQAGTEPVPARARSLEALLAHAATAYGAVLLHDGADGSQTASIGAADAVTVLFDGRHGHGEGSSAWAWRSLRAMRDTAGPGVSLRAGDVSARPGSPLDRIRGAAGGALGFDVAATEPLAETYVARLVYRGTVAARVSGVIDAVRRRPDHAARGSNEPARTDAAPQGGVAVPEELRGVTPIGARCPDAASIEVGLDARGGVHLIGREAGSLAALLCAERWALSRPESLTAAGAADPVDLGVTLHMLTLDERTPALLSGTRVRAHSIRPCWPG
mgnify:CR=1 FL=1